MHILKNFLTYHVDEMSAHFSLVCACLLGVNSIGAESVCVRGLQSVQYYKIKLQRTSCAITKATTKILCIFHHPVAALHTPIYSRSRVRCHPTESPPPVLLQDSDISLAPVTAGLAGTFIMTTPKPSSCTQGCQGVKAAVSFPLHVKS